MVIDQGRIIEQGRHAELMAQRGHYFRLYPAAQLREASGQPGGIGDERAD